MKKLASWVLVLLLFVSMVPALASAEAPVELIWWMGTNDFAPNHQAEVELALNVFVRGIHLKGRLQLLPAGAGADGV